jgi:hypothetical protein
MFGDLPPTMFVLTEGCDPDSPGCKRFDGTVEQLFDDDVAQIQADPELTTASNGVTDEMLYGDRKGITFEATCNSGESGICSFTGRFCVASAEEQDRQAAAVEAGEVTTRQPVRLPEQIVFDSVDEWRDYNRRRDSWFIHAFLPPDAP